MRVRDFACQAAIGIAIKTAIKLAIKLAIKKTLAICDWKWAALRLIIAIFLDAPRIWQRFYLRLKIATRIASDCDCDFAVH